MEPARTDAVARLVLGRRATPKRIRSAATLTRVGLAALLVVMLAAPATQAGATANLRVGPQAMTVAATAGTRPVFVIYYLWWDRSHWASHLGPNYPVSQNPLPLPATLDSTGCGTVTRYPGNVETDVSQGLAYDQSNPKTILGDVELAASTGITGFAVNWVGDGTTTQTPTSSGNNQRLASLIAAVHQVNGEGKPFKLMLDYQSSAKTLTVTQFTNDFNYFLARYGNDSALDHTYAPRPEVIMAGSWKYADGDLATVAQKFRTRLYLLGDERPSTWDASRASNLDGADVLLVEPEPVQQCGVLQAVAELRRDRQGHDEPRRRSQDLARAIHTGVQRHAAVPHQGLRPATTARPLRAVFAGNKVSNPDGWTLISWNEISEGSYIVPLTRYGSTYVDQLRTIVQTNK